jgi:hypothetical protein
LAGCLSGVLVFCFRTTLARGVAALSDGYNQSSLVTLSLVSKKVFFLIYITTSKHNFMKPVSAAALHVPMWDEE